MARLGLALLLGAAAACLPTPAEPGDGATAQGGATAPARAVVRTGLDRVAEDGLGLLDGRRVGLVVHGPSMTRDGEHAIDVMRRRGVDLVRLFSPEHGLRGSAAAGEKVGDGVDPDSGLPIVSFYGPRTGPEPGHLADLDVLVIDLQDVGVRFYTYVSTMMISAGAALDAGLDVVILDRPNPLGGETVSGPVRDPSVPLSMVSRAPGPLVHGLTMGEIARFTFPGAVAPAAGEPTLRVVEMEGWSRDLGWDDTGLPWRNPSPNLRSPAAASLYPAVALFEGTNVSEGRGTVEPFLFFGAPWFDDELVGDLRGLAAAAGVESEAVEFTPTASPAAPSPKHLDEVCVGVRLRPTGSVADLYGLGLRLLQRTAREDAFELRRDGEALTWLLGTPAATEVLLGDADLGEHLAALARDHDDWRRRRADALLY